MITIPRMALKALVVCYELMINDVASILYLLKHRSCQHSQFISHILTLGIFKIQLEQNERQAFYCESNEILSKNRMKK